MRLLHFEDDGAVERELSRARVAVMQAALDAELSEEARAGDFIYVPPYVPHQEINGSTNEICEAVVVRSGQAPVVINLDVETPEPASAGHPGMPFHPGG